MFKLNKIIFILVAVGAVIVLSPSRSYAQGADSRWPLGTQNRKSNKDDLPKSYHEGLQKLRIDREKKEFEKLLGYGEEALKLSEELESLSNSNAQLSRTEIEKVADVEKLVKKIRKELGGDDDDDAAELINTADRSKTITFLRESTAQLYSELKKMTRFTISAAAIHTSNNVLRVTKFLRITK